MGAEGLPAPSREMSEKLPSESVVVVKPVTPLLFRHMQACQLRAADGTPYRYFACVGKRVYRPPEAFSVLLTVETALILIAMCGRHISPRRLVGQCRPVRPAFQLHASPLATWLLQGIHEQWLLLAGFADYHHVWRKAKLLLHPSAQVMFPHAALDAPNGAYVAAWPAGLAASL
eukprot:892301-Amphidinium_carterae.1